MMVLMNLPRRHIRSRELEDHRYKRDRACLRSGKKSEHRDLNYHTTSYYTTSHHTTNTMKLLAFSLNVLPCLAAAVSPVSRAEEGNWETYVNDLGYTSVRFKDGMEPGSGDYTERLGGNNTDAVLQKRQDGWETEPLVGSTKIPWGCDVNVRDGIVDKLYEVCSDLGCDSGTDVVADVDWSNDGNPTTAQVRMKATGRWPSGMLHNMIDAVKAEVPYEAVETHEKTTRGGGNSPYK